MRNLISVVIPLYNKASYIQEAICSVLLNTEELLEVIVVNDGSTDDGPALVNEIKDSRIRLFNQKNGGVSKARNIGMLEAKGRIISFLDADDSYAPQYLKSIVDMYLKFPDAIAYATSYLYLINGKYSEPVFSRSLPKKGYCGKVVNFHKWKKKANFFFTSSLSVNRKRIIDECLFFPEGEQYGEDIDFSFMLAEHGNIIFLREPLAFYRLESENSLSHSNAKDQILPCYSRLIRRLESGLIPADMAFDVKRTYSNQLMGVCRTYALRGQFNEALQFLFKKYSLNAGFYWIKTLLFVARCKISKYIMRN